MNEEAIPIPANEFPALGVFSVWFGVVLVGVTAVSRIFAANALDLEENPLFDSLYFALIALILASFLYLTLRVNNRIKQAAVPLIINLSTLLIVRFVPFGGLWQDLRFEWNQARYQAVVDLVESGKIQPNELGEIPLPWQYRRLSAGGVIQVDTSDEVTKILFLTNSSSPTNFAGYVYHADNLPPKSGEFDGRWRYVAQQRPFWFFCASY
ncbi:MAG: hypothetical protein ACE5EY_01765 [Anaerolineae bacterium]